MTRLQSPTARDKAHSTTKQPSKHSREKASRFALLGMLSFGGKRSGYDLKKAIASSMANFWSESYGNIYPRLRELVDEGLIRPHAPASTDTGRKKQLYSITAKGRQALTAWLSEPVVPRHEDNELLLKLFFGSSMPAQVAADLVMANREHHERLLRQFDIFAQSLHEGPLSQEEKAYLQITIEYGRAISKALLDWAKQTAGVVLELHSVALDK